MRIVNVVRTNASITDGYVDSDMDSDNCYGAVNNNNGDDFNNN